MRKEPLIYLIFCLSVCFANNTYTQSTFPQTVNYQGIRVVCDLQHLQPTATPDIFREGEEILFKFTISDTVTGNGLSGVYPAAWLARDQVYGQASCGKKVESFLTGSILNQADLDLNVYYVLTLNDDASINVVDPLFGYGNTKLLNRITLTSPGMDWALTDDQDWLFVTMPAAKQVAVIETQTWTVVRNIDLPGVPVHAVLQPDEAYLWVTYVAEQEADESTTGVAVINVSEQSLVKTIPTGAGWHELVVTDDNSRVFVTNSTSGTTSVIDIGKLTKTKDITMGGNPTSITWSSLAQVAYVGHKASGRIAVIGGDDTRLLSEIQTEPGIEHLSFAPGGRFAFVVNPGEDIIHILDAVSNQLIQTADMESEPDRVSYTDGIAYIRHRNSSTILMIPLEGIGVPGAAVNVVDFPGGQNPAGKTKFPTPAAGIVPAVGENAVLVANPLDKTIYYYMEGMAAPMGNFSNYGRQPRAVLVVDRSLQEKAPGVYQTAAKLRDPGRYDIAFFMNAPRLIHCFQLEVQADPEVQMKKLLVEKGPLEINYQKPTFIQETNTAVQLQMEIKDRITKEPIAGLVDVKVLATTSAGDRHYRFWAEATDQPGWYQVEMPLPAASTFQIFTECLSQGFSMHLSPGLIVEIPE
ncbi:MAG: hypothetical protein DHS20C18_10490 [Saprospiraceae bacterium]|nr:MAG: hypothetical protein DHS20C18_10490 [Saprospiraceae bacterium]